MKLDATPLIGQAITSVNKKDFSWFFVFDNGDQIVTESPWRLVTDQGIVVTSEDHEQSFGLPLPVDATESVKATLGSTPITDIHDDTKTGDLFIRFSGGRHLQFLQLSSGYEGWRLRIGDCEFICKGGGGYTSFPRQNTNSSVHRIT